MNLLYYLKGHLGNAKAQILDTLSNISELQINKRLKDIHTDQDCFILGSGHSILTQNLKLLKGKIVMSQNHFHMHEDIGIIKPRYHVIVPKYQGIEFDKDWRSWLDSMTDKLPSDTILFAGLNTKYLIDEVPALKNRTHYIQPGYNALFMNDAKVDLSKRIMKVPTVITQCISIAIYMGFKRIYLTGFDLDQLCRIQSDRNNVRFYGNSQITSNKAEKDSENEYASSGIDWFNMWAIWKQLNILKKYSESRNIEIINITNGGLLNVFKRQNYNKILEND